METTTALPVISAGADRWPTVQRFGRNRFVLGGAAVTLVAAGFAWQWSWLVAIGVAPLLLSVAPCAIMCALGMCMMGRGGSSCKATKADTSATLDNPVQLEKLGEDERIGTDATLVVRRIPWPATRTGGRIR